MQSTQLKLKASPFGSHFIQFAVNFDKIEYQILADF